MSYVDLINTTGDIRLNGWIAMYPTLFEPRRVGRRGRETGEPRFSLKAICPVPLPQDDWAKLQHAQQEAINYLWKGNPPPDLADPWGDAKTVEPSLAGHFMITANSPANRPPEVFNAHNERMTLEHQAQIFSGCIVHAHLRIFAYNRGGQGVSAALQGIMLVDSINVKRLDGRVASTSVFGIQEGFPAATAPAPGAAPLPNAGAPGPDLSLLG